MNDSTWATRWTAIKTACRTLRFRLMIWNAMVVLLTAGVTLACLRAGVRFALLHEVDQLLAEDLRVVMLTLKDAPVDHAELQEGLNQRAQGHRPHGWFVVFLDNHGQPLWSSANTPPEATENLPGAGDMVPLTVGNNRILEHRIVLEHAGIDTIRVGASLLPIGQDMARIDRQVAIAAGVVLLLAPLLGYWLAGRATEPLSDMIHTASRLRPSHLDERLTLRGTQDELDQLAATINGLLDRIAVHLERKRDLLANAAHELRTPLAAIRSSIEVTLNEERAAADYQELLGEIIEESGHLETLVNQLLLLSETEVDTQPGNLPPMSLDRVVVRSVEMFRGVAESAPNRGRSEPPAVRRPRQHRSSSSGDQQPAGQRGEIHTRRADGFRWRCAASRSIVKRN